MDSGIIQFKSSSTMQLQAATPVLGALLCKSWITAIVSHVIGQIIILTFVFYNYSLGISTFLDFIFLVDNIYFPPVL